MRRNEIDYYRDEEIAELGHRTRNHSSDAAYIAACSPDNILKLLSALAAAQARLAALEGALRDCVDAMHEDNPASGWKEIIDNGRAALSGSQSADPRDAVVEAAIEVRQARKQHSAARLSVTGELKAANDRVCAAERSLEAAVDRLAPTKGDG